MPDDEKPQNPESGGKQSRGPRRLTKIGTLRHCAIAFRCCFNAWAKWLDAKPEERGPWPKEATGELLTAAMGRIIRIGPIAFILALTPPAFIAVQLWLLWNQTEILLRQTELAERQNEMIDLQNIFAGYQQTSQFREMLAGPEPLSVSELMEKDKKDPDSAPHRFPPPNLAVVRQLVLLARQTGDAVAASSSALDALKTLLQDSNSTVSAGALLALHQLKADYGKEPKRLHRANLRKTDLSNADLSKADLGGADLSDAVLNGADLSNANLRDANLRDASVCGAKLVEAFIFQANLSFADLGGADLSQADLRVARLDQATLIKAVLDGADLTFANLSASDLSYASLVKSNLGGADLSLSKLQNADLTFANLGGANLDWADLSGANVRGINSPKDADVTEAMLNSRKFELGIEKLALYESIRSLSNTTLKGIRNPPLGFLLWAKKKGAILDEGGVSETENQSSGHGTPASPKDR